MTSRTLRHFTCQEKHPTANDFHYQSSHPGGVTLFLTRVTVSNVFFLLLSLLLYFQLLCIFPFCTNAQPQWTELSVPSVPERVRGMSDNNPQIPSLPSWLLSVLTSGMFLPTHYWRCGLSLCPCGKVSGSLECTTPLLNAIRIIYSTGQK